MHSTERQALFPQWIRHRFLDLMAACGAAPMLGGCRDSGLDRPLAGLSSPPGLSARPSDGGDPVVAVRRCVSYSPDTIRPAVQDLLDDLGGIRSVVRPGARVGIKTNLTGASCRERAGQAPAIETFITHPGLVMALVNLCLEAGAGEVCIMDGAADRAFFGRCGYEEAARPLQIPLVNLCLPAPYLAFQSFPVGAGAHAYPEFRMHRILREIDVFISVAKMKCHVTAGVTLSLKNLVGLAPIELYRRKPTDRRRTALHGAAGFDSRLSGVIVDLNRARPIHLAVIDGIKTAEGGEGPWAPAMSPVAPGLLLASRDPVAADAVATAIMGFDPEAAPHTLPFMHAGNHLAMARDAGLGTNQIKDIAVIGPSILEAACHFRPAA
jgi:uncharacterized protein (DUF362 family)